METNKTSAPSKETIIQMLSEQIEVTKLRVELQELNTKFAQLRLEELKSVAITAQITNPSPSSSSMEEGAVPHKLTQEDLDNNPELISKGFKVGDEVFIHQDDEEDEETPVEEKKKDNSKRNLRKS